jgi:hypothetical protein
VPFIENDAVLGDVDEHLMGDYLNEETILKMARAQGFSSAAIGKLGPTHLSTIPTVARIMIVITI